MPKSDVGSLLDALLRRARGEPQPPKPRRLDADAFGKSLSRHPEGTISQRLEQETAPGQAAFYVYRGERALRDIARGMAVACERPTHVVELVSDDLSMSDVRALLRPLLDGGVLCVVHEADSGLPGRLAESWSRFCRNPSGYVAPVARNLVLNQTLTSTQTPGAVLVVQRQHRKHTSSELPECPLVEATAAELVALSGRHREAIPALGRRALHPEFASHQAAYRESEALVVALQSCGAEQRVARLLVRRSMAGTAAHELEGEFRSHDLSSAFEELYERFARLGVHCRKLEAGFTPLPDVYAAAIVVRRTWEAAPDHSQLYRGQRDATWKTTPAFFRPDADGSAPDLAERERRLAGFVEVLQRAYPSLDELACIAVAQHVSEAARTPTWLIDVTWDPLVALFFASLGGRTGDVGVVDRIVRDEWKRYVAREPALRGSMNTIDVQGIERITRQRGLFLNAPRDDLYQRYAPHRIWFRQHDGLVFNDVAAAISKDHLLPPEPRLDRLLRSLDAAVSDKAWEPVRSSRPTPPEEPLTARLLLQTLVAQDELKYLNEYHRLVIELAAEMFARPETWASDAPDAQESLHRLNDAVLRLNSVQERGHRCDFPSALELTRSRMSPERWQALLDGAHRLWMERHRIRPAIVMEATYTILEDTRGLAPTTLAVVFPGPRAHADRVIEHLATAAAWRFVDARSATEAAVANQMESLVAGGVVLLAIDPDPPRVLCDLAAAITGRFDHLAVGETQLPIANDTVIVFVFGIGSSFHTLSGELQKLIPYVQAVDEFQLGR